MTVLATREDVEAGLGRSLTADEYARADALLVLASAHVEVTTRARFGPGPHTVGRRVRSGRVRLPGKASTVDEVRNIDECDGTATVLTVGVDYTARGRVVYGLGSRAYVEVDFTIAEDTPAPVVEVVAGIVASTIAGPPIGTASQSAGTYQVSYVNSTGKVWLSASDKAILGRYTNPTPAIDLVP